jgi:exonuclease III
MEIRLVTWNANGRTRVLEDQIAAITGRHPDLIALQEVTATTTPLLR